MVSILCVRLPAAFCIWYQKDPPVHTVRPSAGPPNILREPETVPSRACPGFQRTAAPVSYTHLELPVRSQPIFGRYATSPTTAPPGRRAASAALATTGMGTC